MKIRVKNLSAILFTIFFCYFFVFYYILETYIDEILIIAIMPLLYFLGNKKFSINKMALPFFIMFILIVIWSTEAHSSYIYYFIMLEALLFVKVDFEDVGLVLGIIRTAGFINAIAVLLQRIDPTVFLRYANIVFSSNQAKGFRIAFEKGYYSGINNQVSFTALYICLSLIIEIVGKDKTSKNWFEIIVMALAFILTNKRSHLIYLAAALVAIYYISANRNKKFDRIIKIGFLGAIAVAMVYVGSMVFPNIRIFKRIISIFDSSGDLNTISSGRYAIYLQVINLFKTSPVWGIGWQNFADYSVARSVSGGINQGHNVFLQLLCETGVVGFVLFLSLTLYYLIKIVKQLNYMIKRPGHEIIEKRHNFSDMSVAKLSACFFIFYFLFWFSGNALYDFPFVYIWCMSIILYSTVLSIKT